VKAGVIIWVSHYYRRIPIDIWYWLLLIMFSILICQCQVLMTNVLVEFSSVMTKKCALLQHFSINLIAQGMIVFWNIEVLWNIYIYLYMLFANLIQCILLWVTILRQYSMHRLIMIYIGISCFMTLCLFISWSYLLFDAILSVDDIITSCVMKLGPILRLCSLELRQ